MPNHAVVSVVNALKAILETNTLDADVSINLLDPIQKCQEKVFHIVMGPDNPEGGSAPLVTQYIDSELDIFIDCHAVAAADSWWLEVMVMRTESHKLIMADGKLGLSFVLDTTVLGAEEPAAEAKSEKVHTRLRTLWRIKYRTSLTDPSV